MLSAVKNYFKSIKKTFSFKDVMVAVLGMALLIVLGYLRINYY